MRSFRRGHVDMHLTRRSAKSTQPESIRLLKGMISSWRLGLRVLALVVLVLVVVILVHVEAGEAKVAAGVWTGC